uniref:Uncharacterized protein n=1 Tax=Kwoniella dejecticola CBS 10117 TaxID=1296121 RepID=A0A1A6A1J8_9TREE|nr:uncharacterized protein I303_06222 [Kwoniella dejecticola CBS 10117]OBR83936.1 hypothetical protein I303_06222 [Kwoniella dejecticola CBS 10117]
MDPGNILSTVQSNSGITGLTAARAQGESDLWPYPGQDVAGDGDIWEQDTPIGSEALRRQLGDHVVVQEPWIKVMAQVGGYFILIVAVNQTGRRPYTMLYGPQNDTEPTGAPLMVLEFYSSEHATGSGHYVALAEQPFSVNKLAQEKFSQDQPTPSPISTPPTLSNSSLSIKHIIQDPSQQLTYPTIIPCLPL